MARSPFQEFHEQALTEVMSLLGSNIVYRGQTYRGIVNALESSNELQDGGDLENLATIVIISRLAFDGIPVAGEKLVIDGSEVRIEKVDKDEVSFHLTCVTAAK